ncbi:ABC transporter ATP-binding protein [Parvibium lacunae]|uniref:ABC transporter ATP-binding protein n=1 Tax=Parvibium lacunae TaxID=1888893 RepID=A0A368L816_9BURK|nr:ABC transporter ATP-binding protein [Parvibium lacunae]RCS59651.1 ABC transporter ATP-binding protein [Parvibium lacunae]
MNNLLAAGSAPVATAFALECRGVSKTFHDTNQAVQVLNRVDLAVKPGERIAIVGASGSGKSTLLHLLGGLDSPSHGEVLLGGRAWGNMNERTRSQWRNQALGMVYQFHHLLPEFTAQENVMMPLRIRREPDGLAQAQAQAILEQLGLGHRLHHRPGLLSGGERQRVAMARALVTRPLCVLADEPTGNLDRETAQDVFAAMTQMAQATGTAFVVVTHDMELAQRTDRVYRLQQGALL